MQKRKKEKIFFSIGVKMAVSNRYLLKNVRSKRRVFCVESKKNYLCFTGLTDCP